MLVWKIIDYHFNILASFNVDKKSKNQSNKEWSWNDWRRKRSNASVFAEKGKKYQ